jgi:hypothetical protein
MLLRERPNLTNNTEAQSTTVGVSASVYEKLSPIFREHLEAIKNKYGDSANNLTTKQEALLHVINTTDNPREAQSVIYKLMFVDQSNGEDSKQEAAQAEVFQNLSTQEISYTLINLIKSKIEKKEISITQISELNSLNKYCDLINTLQESNLLTPPKLFKRILI